MAVRFLVRYHHALMFPVSRFRQFGSGRWIADQAQGGSDLLLVDLRRVELHFDFLGDLTGLHGRDARELAHRARHSVHTAVAVDSGNLQRRLHRLHLHVSGLYQAMTSLNHLNRRLLVTTLTELSAIPRSACASAGASLIPSPTMATRRPADCSFFTSSAFDCGSTSARKCSSPSCVAMACAVTRLSPVSITTSSPIRRSAWTMSRECAFRVSATATIPASFPSTATYTGVLPSRASPRPAASAPASEICRSRSICGFPTRIVRPPTVAAIPCPGTAPNQSGRVSSTACSVARRTIASPRGCSDPHSADPADRSTSAARNPSSATTSVTDG